MQPCDPVLFVLNNGLRVVVIEEPQAPVVTIAVTYNVGSRSERQGRSGFAHLFEHMMFQGSANVGKAEHMQIVESHGGSLNGFTMKDFTAYYETLPVGALEMGLWLEADRMRSLAVTQENFDNQKDVVKEEKRWRYDNKPYMTAINERFPKQFFDRWENFHTTIGSFEDLERATIRDIKEFFDTFYVPNNACLTVVGGVKAPEVRRLAQKHFGKILKVAEPPRPELAETPQAVSNQGVYQDPFAAIPALLAGWRAPARESSDYKALVFAGAVLADGEDSRLYQKLVKEKEMVLDIGGGLGWPLGSFQILADPAPFGLIAHLKPGVSPDQVLGIIEGEIRSLARGEITEDEAQRVRRKMEADLLDDRQGTETRAWALGIYSWLHRGDPSGFGDELAEYLGQSNPASITRAVAQGYLELSRAGILIVRPGPKPVKGMGEPAASLENGKLAPSPQPSHPLAGAPADGGPAVPSSSASRGKGEGGYKSKAPSLLKKGDKAARKKFHEFRLDGGLRVALAQDHRLGFIKWRLLIPVGSSWAGREFLAKRLALAALLKSGTKNRKSARIEADLAGMGGYLDAAAGHDFFSLSGSVLTGQAFEFAGLLAELLTETIFPENEVDLWRVNTLEEIKEQRTHPEFLLGERWCREIYGKHPYADVAPDPGQVEQVRREDLLSLAPAQFDWRGGRLAVVGDVKPNRLKEILTSSFGSQNPNEGGVSAPASHSRLLPGPAVERRISLVDRPGSAQSEIALGHLSISRRHSDFDALALFNAVLGVTFNSRLNRKLREEKGYTYGIGSSLATLRDTGVFKAGCAVRTEVTGAALKEIFSELERALKEGITGPELEVAKKYVIGSDMIRQGSQDSLADKMAGCLLLDLQLGEINKFRSRMRKVSVSDANKAGRRHIKPDRSLIVVVGDAQRIGKDLEEFGPVKNFDQTLTSLNH